MEKQRTEIAEARKKPDRDGLTIQKKIKTIYKGLAVF
jgi:hypothetical protein